MSTSIQRRRSAVCVAAAAIAMLMAGCTAQAAETPLAADPAPTNRPVADAPIEAVSAVGSTEFPGIGFPIPEYARSLAIDFECAGGAPFSVELGDSMMLGQSPLSGTCDGVSELAWPITSRTGPTLTVTVAEGVEWTAAFAFSQDEFPTDQVLAGECEQFSMSLSALLNADNGLEAYGAIDESEWADRIETARSELLAIASSADTNLKEAFTGLLELASDPNLAPGFTRSADAEQPLSIADRLCGLNQTPILVMDEFGG